MQKKIVTISRQYGSGGRYIGKKLSEKLGIPCYDEKLIDMVAKESGFAQDFVAEKGERMTGSLLFNIASSLSYANNVFSGNGVSLQDEIYFIQNKIIKDLAEKGSCVIVGRCADYALSEYKDCFSVFVHADTDWRINRLSQKHNKTAKEAKDMINKTDKSRSSYYNYYTNKKWGAASSYNLCVDSSKLGIDGAAKAIIQAIEIFDSIKNK